MKIIQIMQSSLGITGLGDDGNLYVWNGNIKEFVPA